MNTPQDHILVVDDDPEIRHLLKTTPLTRIRLRTDLMDDEELRAKHRACPWGRADIAQPLRGRVVRQADPAAMTSTGVEGALACTH